ncbi:MAG: rod shape-determining protein MreD [Candidatus Omnitrophica bacterium]|nr:rod shape-determining protein MreD [Candidatus Omnitrophota bacterium]
MRTWLFFLIIFGLCIFQVTWLNNFKVLGVKPDFLLAAVVIVSLNYSWQEAFFLSASSGALKDVFGTGAFGINTFLFSLWSILIILLSRKISVENRSFTLMLMLCVALLNAAFTRLILAFSGNFIRWSVFLRVTIIESVYTTLLLPLMLEAVHPVLSLHEQKEEQDDNLEEEQL